MSIHRVGPAFDLLALRPIRVYVFTAFPESAPVESGEESLFWEYGVPVVTSAGLVIGYE